MHIVGLEVENFKRIRAVNIEPDATGAVVISGRNAQGKSSLMDAIWAAIGGRAGNTDSKPIRDGEDQAKVVLDLGDMIVTRIWRNGTTMVKVMSADGAEYKSPQSLLDSFFGKLSFDPLAFTRLGKREQKDALLQLVTLDVDIDALEAERTERYEERTEVGRRHKLLGEAPRINPTLPPEELSAVEIHTALDAAREITSARVETLREVTENAASEERIESEIKALKNRLEEVRKRAVVLESQHDALPALPDVDQLRAELDGLAATNAAIRDNNAARELSVNITKLANEYADLSEKITAIDEEKASALARAEFPVDGLGFDADGVTFGGIPFAQSSSAEQIRVSMAMAMATNPKLKVIRIMDGSLLDDDGLKLITDMAAENGFQVWVEKVANGDGVGFVIEDGELVEAADATGGSEGESA